MAEEHSELIRKLEDNVCSVVLGKREAVRLSIVALLAGGHILIEDAPGLGKTALAKAFARSVNCKFTRLQFTPDLLPSDILGSSIYRPNVGEFEFREGPIFTNVLLADEINRTPPRTQSALLEAMNEQQVSVEGSTQLLPAPFFVIATQNPFEFEGTYPLPENQLDRFMLCINLGYPSRESEREILTSHRTGEPVDSLHPVLDQADVVKLQEATRAVKVEDSISDYLLDIVTATRESDELTLGTSTRGALTMYRAVQGCAITEGRDYAVPDDVKRIAPSVLAHRVIPNGFSRESQRQRAAEVIQDILNQIAVPS